MVATPLVFFSLLKRLILYQMTAASGEIIVSASFSVEELSTYRGVGVGCAGKVRGRDGCHFGIFTKIFLGRRRLNNTTW